MDLIPRKGLLYGELNAHNIVETVVLPAQDTYYQVTAWSDSGGTNGEFNGIISDAANDNIPVPEDGRYMVTWSLSCYASFATDYEFEVHKNKGSTKFENTEGYRTTSTAAATGNVGGGGICNLSKGDTVELWVERQDGGAVSKTLTIRQVRLSIVRISD